MTKAELQNLLDVARSALKHYGANHKVTCYGRSGGDTCSCGFTETMKNLGVEVVRFVPEPPPKSPPWDRD